MTGALVNPNVKPKYKLGQWVKFRTGKRVLHGCIMERFISNANGAIYDIARNKQNFRMIYERNILEVKP